MKTARLLSTALSAALLVAGAAWAQDKEAPKPNPKDLEGKPAPAIELDLLGGGTLNLDDFKGKKYVVLDFWGTWCPWCVKATEHFEAARERWSEKDVAFFMVSLGDTKETLEKFVEKHKLKSEIAMDPDFTTLPDYLVDYVPHIVVINKEGKIVRVEIGEDDVGPAIEETLTKELGAPEKDA